MRTNMQKSSLLGKSKGLKYALAIVGKLDDLMKLLDQDSKETYISVRIS